MTPPNTTRGMRLPDVLPGSTSPRVVPFSDSMVVNPLPFFVISAARYPGPSSCMCPGFFA